MASVNRWLRPEEMEYASAAQMIKYVAIASESWMDSIKSDCFASNKLPAMLASHESLASVDLLGYLLLFPPNQECDYYLLASSDSGLALLWNNDAGYQRISLDDGTALFTLFVSIPGASSFNVVLLVTVTKENRAAGVLDNFAEGEKYAEHFVRRYVRNKAPEIMPSINSFFTDPNRR
ncbi:hypothetical protein Cgig2_004200 [Carnegiea gigantea]|uniref:Uncharacterized protein n=1 Tax=Carnegiea gigantea TaxID=171969 RepID=A0A9Q1QR02_9CARY|nr:hypothetical protein Cgig2_004200 [Carnegiea gigantea]